MPKLKCVLDNLDDLEAKYHELYEEKDGKFYLTFEGVETHPSTTNLRNALEAQKALRRKAVDEFTAFKEKYKDLPEDFSIEEYARLKTENEELKADPTKNKGNAELASRATMLEQQLKSKEEAHKREVEKISAKLKQREGYIERLLIDEGLTKALIDANVDKAYLKAAKAMLRDQVKVREENDEYHAVIDTDTGPIEIPKFVTDWVASDEGKAFVPPARGGDAGGGVGKQQMPKMGSLPHGIEHNPWDPKHLNLTHQGMLLKTDRPLAAKLAKQHGTFIPPAAP